MAASRVTAPAEQILIVPPATSAYMCTQRADLSNRCTARKSLILTKCPVQSMHCREITSHIQASNFRHLISPHHRSPQPRIEHRDRQSRYQGLLNQQRFSVAHGAHSGYDSALYLGCRMGIRVLSSSHLVLIPTYPFKSGVTRPRT
jgi:hypothetical protein